jgi:hypothetical protein
MVKRVVGRVSAAGVVDTTTLLNTAFNTSDVRAATTSDGTSFWVGGASAGLPTTGGIWVAALGSTGAATQVLAAPDNARWVNIFGGQLYGTSGSLPFTDVFTVGTGLPLTAGQTATPLPGMPTTGPSPYGFVLLDRNSAVPGVDTLYVADDRLIASGGGVQKWTFNGTTWTQVPAFMAAQLLGARGLAGTVSGNTVTLIAATVTNTIEVIIDDGVIASPVPATIHTADPFTAYRGVALAPR